VDRKQFEAGMRAIGITDELIIEQNFIAFDQNRDGLIDFREYVFIQYLCACANN